MKLMTFSEINDLENGQQISALQGTVKKVFDQLTGEGQYGIWWLQSFIMTDDHANEIKCTWSAEDKIDELEGKSILIESGRDKKDQLAGIKKEIKNKNGKRYETVKLDDRCTIRKMNGEVESSGDENGIEEIEESGGGATFRKVSGIPTDKGIGNMAKKAWAESEQRNPNGGVDEARKHLMQSANLYNLCVSAVDKAIAPNMPNIAQTSEQFQAAVGTLFIEASRAGLVAKMPTTPVHKGNASPTASTSTEDLF